MKSAALEACEAARKAGALGAKLSGAGGGGVVLALAPGAEAEVSRAFERLGATAFVTVSGRTSGVTGTATPHSQTSLPRCRRVQESIWSVGRLGGCEPHRSTRFRWSGKRLITGLQQ